MAFKKGTTLPEERMHIDCAHAPQCTRTAQIRERVMTGWANLCLQHYHERIEKERIASWTAAGRPTVEQSMAKMHGLRLKTIVAEREPGSDDE